MADKVRIFGLGMPALLPLLFWITPLFANQPLPTAVEVLQLSLQNVPLKVELPTVLMGDREVEIRARVEGQIEEILFKDGDLVEQGQSLFRLDTGQLKATLDRAEADLVALEARLDQATRNLRRVTALKSQRAIAQKDVDDAVSAEAIAQADILAAQARVQEAELNLGYADIKAPLSGFASRAQVSVGDFVQGPDEVLVQLAQLNPIRARFSLPTRAYQAIQAEAATGAIVLPEKAQWKARLKMGYGLMYSEPGQVQFVDARVNPLTGSQEGYAVFPNPGQQLQPGQYLRIFLEGAYRPKAIAIPQGAVIDGSDGKFVYRYASSGSEFVAQPQPVTLGEWVVLDGQNYWVVRQGLMPDDQIIISGQSRIFQPMTPVQARGPVKLQGKSGEILSEESI